MNQPERFVNLHEYEQFCQQNLAALSHDYYHSGAMDEHTLRDNQHAFNRIKLLPRVLKDVSSVDTKTKLYSHQLDAPILISPTAFLGMAHSLGEVAVAKAAQQFNTVMICSTLSNYAIEEITAHHSNVWFQLYVYKNKTETLDLINRAKNAGCKAIVITVDAPYLGQRERDKKNNFSLPKHLHLKNLHAEQHSSLIDKSNESSLAEYFAQLIDKSLTWKDISWLKNEAEMPIYLKGILHPEDARLALEHGVDGLIVSNHGGRQLDGSVSSIDALPAINNVIRQQIPIILDGGIRRGTDVLKAIALGASAVGIGRPTIWGLHHNGQAGVESILNILQDELSLAMALSGCRNISEITEDILA